MLYNYKSNIQLTDWYRVLFLADVRKTQRQMESKVLRSIKLVIIHFKQIFVLFFL